MKVICDADGLIKMAKAGILDIFARHVEVLVSPQVYREAVEDGKARGYPDAVEIERVLERHGHRVQPPKRRRTNLRVDIVSLGAGEQEILQVLSQERADVVLSDDRAFLSILETLGISYMTPGAALLFLVEQNAIQVQEAQQALEQLRSLIRHEQYEAVFQDLQGFQERSRR